MGGYNESSVDIKYFFQIEWDVSKKLYLEKFSFGSRDDFGLNGQKPFAENPVYIYPDNYDYMEVNSARIALREFYDSGSVFPICSIQAELKPFKRIKIAMIFIFQNVRILEHYGEDWKNDRYNLCYKFEFDNWF